MADVKWPCIQEKEASFKIGHAQKDLAAERPRESVALSDGRTSESTIRMSDELMALPADKHANHCYDSASSHPGVLDTAQAASSRKTPACDTQPCMPLWLQRQCSAQPAFCAISAPGIRAPRRKLYSAALSAIQESDQGPVKEMPCEF